MKITYAAPSGAPGPGRTSSPAAATSAGAGAEAPWRAVNDPATAPCVPHRPELRDLPCDFMYSVQDLDTRAVLGVA
ncbi:3-oxoacyl-ACP synthase, partial [Streptomyces sp. OfavH-34-F]|nr:3-oxoacyl-ACP synthase [Streptomyces sp. OfavH-34-F]